MNQGKGVGQSFASACLSSNETAFSLNKVWNGDWLNWGGRSDLQIVLKNAHEFGKKFEIFKTQTFPGVNISLFAPCYDWSEREWKDRTEWWLEAVSSSTE